MDTSHRTYLNTKQLGHALSVCPATIRRWTRSGRIPCIVLAKRVIRYDLDAVIASLTKTSQGGKNHG